MCNQGGARARYKHMHDSSQHRESEMLSVALTASLAMLVPGTAVRHARHGPHTIDSVLTLSTRRAALSLLTSAVIAGRPAAALAVADCMQTCKKNCNRNAPGSASYCDSTCVDYCGQDDRKDGLSGSVSTEGSEFGWQSSFKNPLSAQKPVEFGDDLPPGLPDVFGYKNALRKAVAGGDLTGGVQGQGGARDYSDLAGTGLPFRAKPK